MNALIEEIAREVERATRKFPTWPTDPLHALAVLGEEFGELTKDMLQLTYEPHKTSPEKVRTEAVQTAAMAFRLLASLDRYRYAPCHQHSQSEQPQPRKPASEGDQYIGMTLGALDQRIAAEQGAPGVAPTPETKENEWRDLADAVDAAGVLGGGHLHPDDDPPCGHMLRGIRKPYCARCQRAASGVNPCEGKST